MNKQLPTRDYGNYNEAMILLYFQPFKQGNQLNRYVLEIIRNVQVVMMFSLAAKLMKDR